MSPTLSLQFRSSSSDETESLKSIQPTSEPEKEFEAVSVGEVFWNCQDEMSLFDEINGFFRLDMLELDGVFDFLITEYPRQFEEFLLQLFMFYSYPVV